MNASKLVLLAEENPDDAFLFLRAVQKVGIRNPVQLLSGTNELRAYLLGESPYHDRSSFPLPGLVFLSVDDRVNPPEPFLQWLRQESSSPNLLVVGLGDVENPTRIQKLFDLGMNAFFLKQLDPTATVSLIQELDFMDEILETRADIAI